MLDKITEWIEWLFFRFSALALFLLCVVMMVEVLFRYLPGLSLAQPWIPGVLSLLDIWLIFMGSVVAMRAGTHLRITFFINRMPAGMRKVNNLAVNIINLVLLLAMAWYSVPIVETGMDLTFGGVPFSKGYSFIALPVCALLMALMVIRNIMKSFLEMKED